MVFAFVGRKCRENPELLNPGMKTSSSLNVMNWNFSHSSSPVETFLW